VRAPYRSYGAAALTLASVPRAQDFLTAAVEELVSSPGIEVVTSPGGLLARLPTRRAAEVVLNVMADPPAETTYWLAVWAVTQKVRTGMFTEAETARLHMLLLEQWRRDPVETAEDFSPELSCAVAGRLSDAARPCCGPGW
jgi:hypothetical protein